ncbi:MAG: sugar phosphate isomerase/epimerase family protein [Victivallaceae bacterium]
MLGSGCRLKGSRHAAAQNHLDLSSYTIGASFLVGDNGELDDAGRQREVERLKKQVDIAAKLGVKLMRHDVGWRPMEKCTLEQFEIDLPVVAPCCRAVAEYAAKFGIVTSLENHGYHFQGSERVRRLVNLVNLPNYRTTIDVGNFICADEDPVSAVMNNISIASMIHFKDFYVRNSVPTPDGWFKSLHGKFLRGAITGCGDLNLSQIAKVIKNSNYDGYVSVEFEGIEECKAACKIALNNTKALLNQIN